MTSISHSNNTPPQNTSAQSGSIATGTRTPDGLTDLNTTRVETASNDMRSPQAVRQDQNILEELDTLWHKFKGYKDSFFSTLNGCDLNLISPNDSFPTSGMNSIVIQKQTDEHYLLRIFDQNSKYTDYSTQSADVIAYINDQFDNNSSLNDQEFIKKLTSDLGHTSLNTDNFSLHDLPINFSEVKSLAEKLVSLLSTFDSLSKKEKLTLISTYHPPNADSEIPDGADSEIPDGSPGEGRNLRELYHADIAEKKIPKALEKAKQLQENLSQVDQLNSENESPSEFSSKIWKDILHNIPEIRDAHRKLYTASGSNRFNKAARNVTHRAIYRASIFAAHAAKRLPFIDGRYKNVIHEALSVTKHKSHQGSEWDTTASKKDRINLYAQITENYRLLTLHMQRCVDLKKLVGITPTQTPQDIHHLTRSLQSMNRAETQTPPEQDLL